MAGKTTGVASDSVSTDAFPPEAAVIDIADLGSVPDPDVVGTKAGGIGMIAALGLPGIPGIVVTTAGCAALCEPDEPANAGMVDDVRSAIAALLSSEPPDASFSLRPSSQMLVSAGATTRLAVAAGDLESGIREAVSEWDSVEMRIQRRHEQVPAGARVAVTVQPMRYGTRASGQTSPNGAGVAYSRHPITGSGRSMVFLPNAGGADPLVTDLPTMDWDGFKDTTPEIAQELDSALQALEMATADAVEVEFVVVDGDLLLLHYRPAVRSGPAAVRVAAALLTELDLTPAEALQTVHGHHVEQLLHTQLSGAGTAPLATGLGASPGAAVGAVYFSADDAADAYDRGEDVILVAQETSPEDVHGMELAEGILTSRGGLASHAAVVARGWGKPAVCGAHDIKIGAHAFEVNGITVSEGEVITIDGGSGQVFAGTLGLENSDPPPEFETVMAWADEVRGATMTIKANADTSEDAAVARAFGAQGIGLCRTEHQFLGDRLPLIQRVILAHSEAEEAEAIAALEALQRKDFAALLETMDGLPVTIRLLDPPLHEFLPETGDLNAKMAAGSLTAEEQQLLDAAVEWAEVNPMLGTRGIRLGVLRPELYRMQMRAVLHAVADRLAAGGDPKPEIMVPLVISATEMALARKWLAAELAALEPSIRELVERHPIPLGTMVETPRAALSMEQIAPVVDFLSFGTNDLTQLTMGISRDDVEARVMGAYLDQKLLPANPFETLDVGGVGQLVALAVSAARAVAPDLPIGVCGEHGGDPASIGFFLSAGLDSVSCSPYRVPVARLSAARSISLSL